MVKSPFTILQHTVNVLVVDDEYGFYTRVTGLLDLFDIYYVRVAESTGEALDIIEKNNRRFHSCLLDRGMKDVENNEFFLLDKFGKTIPFIIMTAREYSGETFEYGRKGAKAYISKNIKQFDHTLISTLNTFALQNMVCPKYQEGDENLLCKSVEMMLKNNPPLVKDWASDLEILETQLSKEWKKNADVNPKYALYIFRLFSEMFLRINNACVNPETFIRFDLKQCAESLLNSARYNRCLKFYQNNLQKINSYLFKKTSFL